MTTIRSSQKFFTEEEVSSLTGICLDHLRALAGNHHLGSFIEAAQQAGSTALVAAQAAGARAHLLFSVSDLYIVTALFPRCQH